MKRYRLNTSLEMLYICYVHMLYTYVTAILNIFDRLSRLAREKIKKNHYFARKLFHSKGIDSRILDRRSMAREIVLQESLTSRSASREYEFFFFFISDVASRGYDSG